MTPNLGQGGVPGDRRCSRTDGLFSRRRGESGPQCSNTSGGGCREQGSSGCVSRWFGVIAQAENPFLCRLRDTAMRAHAQASRCPTDQVIAGLQVTRAHPKKALFPIVLIRTDRGPAGRDILNRKLFGGPIALLIHPKTASDFPMSLVLITRPDLPPGLPPSATLPGKTHFYLHQDSGPSTRTPTILQNGNLLELDEPIYLARRRVHHLLRPPAFSMYRNAFVYVDGLCNL